MSILTFFAAGTAAVLEELVADLSLASFGFAALGGRDTGWMVILYGMRFGRSVRVRGGRGSGGGSGVVNGVGV